MKEAGKNLTLEDLKNASERVMRQIYEENRSKFLSFARKYNLSDEENKDIYQDAYIIIYDNVVKGKVNDLSGSVGGYLFGVGKNLILKKMRDNKKHNEVPFELSVAMKAGELGSEFEFNDEVASPRQAQMIYQLDALGEKCQELIRSYYYKGLSIKEIMNNENYASENVVKSAKSRCLKLLKERMNLKDPQHG